MVSGNDLISITSFFFTFNNSNTVGFYSFRDDKETLGEKRNEMIKGNPTNRPEQREANKRPPKSVSHWMFVPRHLKLYLLLCLAGNE